MKKSPVVLITGASTGIGRAAAEMLHAKGAKVVATARDLASIADLGELGMDTLQLDVTDDDSMVLAVQATLEKHGGIDALVNNAGFGVMMPTEELPMDQFRHMFDVNVNGLQRMTQLVLPSMREKKSGRIINIASAAGHISLPIMGAYCATKFAVRALSWALAAEMKPFGVKVSLVEPGNIKTHFGKRSKGETEQTGIDRTASPYAAMHRNMDILRFNDRGLPVSIISKRITHACMSRRPRFHYLAPYDAKSAWFASHFLPNTWVTSLTSGYFWRGRSKKA